MDKIPKNKCCVDRDEIVHVRVNTGVRNLRPARVVYVANGELQVEK